MYLDNNHAMDDPCCTFISKMLTVYMCNEEKVVNSKQLLQLRSDHFFLIVHVVIAQVGVNYWSYLHYPTNLLLKVTCF